MRQIKHYHAERGNEDILKRATYEMMHEISISAKREFGDINANGYLAFSQWLQANFAIAKPEEITQELADAILEKLRSPYEKSAERGVDEEVQEAQILEEEFEVPEFFKAVVLTLSKVYMYGVIEGRKGAEIPSDPQEFVRKLKGML